MENDKKIDAIIVGAGPSGIACALTIKRGGYNPVVIEKSSHIGVKNLFGGAVYLESIKELFPDTYKNFPYERIIKKHNYVIFNKDESLSVSYKKNDENTISIYRRNFDSRLADEAKKEGVCFAIDTLVVDLIIKDKKIIGVKTEYEEIYAPIVIVAEGFNSLLLNKAGLKEATEPKDAILGVREVIKLQSDEINKRFNLKDNEGAMYEFFGGLNKENEDVPLAMGFLYTFKNNVSIGVGVSMENLKNNKITPYEYLDRLKNNEFIKPLIEGGELLEYGAHSIPEGGYKKIPKLYHNGCMLVGDCANLVDSIHFEGTNLAIKSGILAGKTAVIALSKNDFSEKVLKNYKKELYKSFVIRDLKTYKSVIETLFKRRESVFSYYPKKIIEFFNIFTTPDNIPKKDKYRNFLFSFIKERKLKDLTADVISFVKCILEAVI